MSEPERRAALQELQRQSQLCDPYPAVRTHSGHFMRTTVPSFNGTTPPQAYHGIEE